MSGPLDFDDGDGHARAPDRDPAAEPTVGEHPSPAASVASPRYAWLTGVVGLILVVALLVGILSRGPGRGARGLETGAAMPPFAVPLVTSGLDADANIATRARQGEAGRVPACSIHRPDVLNGCDLWRRRPAVVVFFDTSERCVAQLDAVERVRRRTPGVSVAAIAVRGSRSRLRRVVMEHRLGFPVGYDRDGALAGLYHVQICPQMTFAARGGRVTATTFGTLGDAALAARLRRLVR